MLSFFSFISHIYILSLEALRTDGFITCKNQINGQELDKDNYIVSMSEIGLHNMYILVLSHSHWKKCIEQICCRKFALKTAKPAAV